MKRVAALVIICIFLLSSCKPASGEAVHSSEFFAMDTVMTLKAHGENAKAAISEAERAIYRLESLLSTELEDSDIRKINTDGSALVNAEVLQLVETALKISEDTDYAFDPTIYPLMCLWGFRTKEYRVPDDEEISVLLGLVGAEKINISDETVSLAADGMGLDLGGLAKGYASDAVAELLREYGVESAIISLGGNVYAVGSRPDGEKWRVVIQDPFDSGGTVGTILLEDEAAVTSGAYQRYFEQDGEIYHHIIDPQTGRPCDISLASVTVISDSGTLSDGLSTALFVMGKDKAIEYWREHGGVFDFVFVTADGEILVSAGIADEYIGDSYTVIE